MSYIIKKLASLLLICMMSLSFVACGSSENNQNAGNESAAVQAEGGENGNTNSNGGKILVAYFSLAGRKYHGNAPCWQAPDKNVTVPPQWNYGAKAYLYISGLRTGYGFCASCAFIGIFLALLDDARLYR